MSSELSSDVLQLEAFEQPRMAPSSSLVDELIADAEVRTLFAQYRERFARTDLRGILLRFATNPALLRGIHLRC